jgi:hypothetical protein
MKSLTRLMVVAGTVLGLAPAQAATNVEDARIVRLRVDTSNNSAVITFDKVPASGKPACATYNTSGQNLGISLATDGGREMFRVAMAAYLAGKRLEWQGTGACTAHSNKEDIGTLYVYD